MMSRAITALLIFILLFSSPMFVYADIIGTLRFTVKSSVDEKPVAGAKIILKDSAGIRPPVTLTTDAEGKALVSQLNARPWQVTVSAEQFENDSRNIVVAVDALTDIEIYLEPIKEKVIKVTSQRTVIKKTQTTYGTTIDRSTMTAYPQNASNPQNLGDILKGKPGFVQDSVNQIHPRGEHSATAIYLNGFELPDALQGRAGQIISAETVQNIDLLTGAYAPEYGGQTAAILNITLRAGTIHPFTDFELRGGGFSTGFGSVTLGGQTGETIDPHSDDPSTAAKKLGYLINLSGRQTDAALEPPQPDQQMAHNDGSSQVLFGNFDYYFDQNNQITVTANSTPAYTQIANRTGLDASYAPFGQGFGFGGQLSAAQATAQGIANQQAAGQDINQRDANTFGVINWRHTFSANLFGMFSLGSVHTGQYLTNNNPVVNLNALPTNSSIEYNPTLFRDGYQNEFQGGLTLLSGNHTFKGGILDNEQSGKESYQLIPGSGIALDTLAATDLRLTPVGAFQFDVFGNPILDSYGKQVYVANPGATTPTLTLTRTGFYRAAYLQDTWKATPWFTLNYGVRYDRYRQSESTGSPTVDQGMLSPRINTVFAVSPDSVFRLSYNRLFIQPPLAQGAILGQPILPETYTQWDASYEIQVGRGQAVKIEDYYKDIRHQIDTGLLIPLTQIGAFTSVNFDIGQIHGRELSYEYRPPNNIGISGFLGYTYQIDKPFGFDNTGARVPAFNDHDQRHTLGVGAADTWGNSASVGLNFYYGSGVASSAIVGDQRVPHSQLDFHAGSGPLFWKSTTDPKEGVGLAFDVVNIFDSKQLLNFQSGFSGTRFQLGRQVFLSMDGHF